MKTGPLSVCQNMFGALKITGEERSDPWRLTYEAEGKDADAKGKDVQHTVVSAGMPAWNGLSAGVWLCLCTPQEPKERGFVWTQDCANCGSEDVCEL